MNSNSRKTPYTYACSKPLNPAAPISNIELVRLKGIMLGGNFSWGGGEPQIATPKPLTVNTKPCLYPDL